jgi:hypothetical protein
MNTSRKNMRRDREVMHSAPPLDCASLVIARSSLVRRSPPSGEGGCDEAIHSFFARQDGLLRGACHRARIRATCWLAMTEVVVPDKRAERALIRDP